MIYGLKDISKIRKGTLTSVNIRRKHLNEKLFQEIINEFKDFIWLMPSNTNLKYFTRKKVAETENLFDKVKKKYFKKLEEERRKNER